MWSSAQVILADIRAFSYRVLIARMWRRVSTLRRGVHLAWQASTPLFVEVASLTVATAIISPTILLLARQFVDRVAAGSGVQGVFGVAVGLGAAEWLNQALSGRLVNRQSALSDLIGLLARSRFLATALAIDAAQYDEPSTHNLMARAGGDLGTRISEVQRTLLGIFGQVTALLGFLGLLASMHPALVVLAVLTAVPAIIVRRSVNRQLHALWITKTAESREQDYLAEVLSKPRWAREVRAFGLGPHLHERHNKSALRQIEMRRALFMRAERVSAAAGLIAGSSVALAFLFVARNARTSGLTPGDLAIIIASLAAVSGRISMFSSMLMSMEQQLAFLDDYFTFLAMRPAPTSRRGLSTAAQMRPTGIDFDGVTFTYPRAGSPAIRDLSLRIAPGELLAIVGNNGAGKSTLVKLLLRLCDPDQGTIRLDGVDTRSIDPNEIRGRIGVLFQDFGRYELTLRDNVAFGRVEARHTDDRLGAALDAARGDMLVSRLPAGLDSRVGGLFDGGHDLSGGEWQRIALARLMYRNAEIWILDEPTSALDTEAEAAVFAELRQQLDGRIGLVISHRLSTVRLAERIAVMDEGRLIELGTHEELLARRGRYASLFECQAAAYQ